MSDREHRQQVDQILNELWRAHQEIVRLSQARLDTLRDIDRAYDRGEDTARLTTQARRLAEQMSQALRRLDPLIRRLMDELGAWRRQGVGREYQRFYDEAGVLSDHYHQRRIQIRNNLEHEEGIHEPAGAR